MRPGPVVARLSGPGPAAEPEALTLAQELAHPFSLAYALYFAAMLHQFRREAQPTQERAEALMALAGEQGFAQWLARGTIMRGWALAEPGSTGSGRDGADASGPGGLAGHGGRGCDSRIFLPCWPRRMGQVGQTEEGLSLLAEALAVVDSTGERCGKRSCIGSRGSCCWRSAGGRQQCGGGGLFSPGPRHGPPPAGQVAGSCGPP